MPGSLRSASNDDDLEGLIRSLGTDKCTVVYFFLPWCGACQKMTPFVESMAVKNPAAVFLKVDAEVCMGASKKHRVSKVPLFVLYNNKTRVDRVEGASPIELETKIKRIQGEIEKMKSLGVTQPTAGIPPSVRVGDISAFFDKKNCRVINDLSPTPLQGFLDGTSRLVSGKGVGRLLLVYAFTEKMVIQSFKIKAPSHSGPRVLRFFTNTGKNLTDINTMPNMTANQEVMLSEDDLRGEHVIDLRQGGFSGITGLHIFIPESMANSRRVEIEYLILNGFSSNSSADHNTTTTTPKFGTAPGVGPAREFIPKIRRQQ